MTRPRTRRLNPHLVLAAAILAFATSPLRAALPTIADFQIGIAGSMQAGRWAPVEFTLKAENGPFDGEIALEATDGDGIPYRIPASDKPLHVDAGATQQLLFHFKPAALDNELRLIFTESDRRTSAQALPVDDPLQRDGIKRALPANAQLMVSVGAGLGLPGAFADGGETESRLAHAVELSTLNALPAQALGFDAIDTLFIATGDPTLNAAWLTDDARVQALTEWTRRGGRLVLCIGREAATVLAPDHPLAQFIPGRFDSQVTLLTLQSTAWEEYAGTKRPLPLDEEEQGERLRVPLVLDFQGKIEAPLRHAPGQPVLVGRAPFGLGEVVFIAADLNEPPFAKWSGRENLLLRAARHQPRNEAIPAATRSAPQHDLVEQLQRALDTFPGVRLAPFLWVAILVLTYIALIGPADYSFLQRFLRRMELTWLTFPLLVALTTFGIYRFAGALKGDQLRVNQVDVVDIDAAGNVRGTTIANIFSPEMARFDLTLRPAIATNVTPQQPRSCLSGFALQPSALTGESNRTAIAPLSAESYFYSAALDRVQELPIHIWSSKSIAAQWFASAPQLVASDLHRTADGQLQGELRLTAELTLEDGWLVDNNFVARLGEVAPNQVLQVGPRAGTPWSTLSSQLSYQRRVQKAPGKEDMGVVGTQWDAESTDVREILRQILFYDAAGGSNYTRSTNGALRQLDLSPRRDLGEAILIGYVRDDARTKTQFINGKRPLPTEPKQHVTILRVLLRVAP